MASLKDFVTSQYNHRVRDLFEVSQVELSGILRKINPIHLPTTTKVKALVSDLRTFTLSFWNCSIAKLRIRDSGVLLQWTTLCAY